MALTQNRLGFGRLAELVFLVVPTALGLSVACWLVVVAPPQSFAETVTSGLIVAGSFLSLVVFVGPLGRAQPLYVAAFALDIVAFGLVSWLATAPLILTALLPLAVVSGVFAFGWRIGLPLAALALVAWIVALLTGHGAGGGDVVSQVVYTSSVGAALALAVAVGLEFGRRRQRQLVRSLTVDPVTTLRTRMQFEIVFGQEFSRSKRFGRPLSVLMIDMDGMKNVNDRFGHQTGDRVLRAAGEAIQRGIRGSDFAARYGGDEFVVVLPETDRAGASTIAAFVKRNVADIRVTSGSNVLVASASVGTSSFPEDGATAAELLARADALMYRDKSARGSRG